MSSRIVLDTNSLVQSVSRKSRYHEIWRSIFDGRTQLCVTTSILEEYEEVLQRLTSNRFASIVISMLVNSANVVLVSTYYDFRLIESDPDDNKFVDCAIAANAELIVTNDKHFNVLREIDYPKVETITIDEFLLYLVFADKNGMVSEP